MRKIKSLNEISTKDYKHIIALTPQDAKIIKTAFEYLPRNISNEPHMKSLLNSIDDVASAEEDSIKNIFNPNCEVCDD